MISPGPLPRWTVYSRAGCTLCDQMCAELAILLGPIAAAVRVVDIEGDPDLERRFGHRIPVLSFDDEFVCAYRLDVERVRAYLDKGIGDRG
jgi:Glutaredoxin-like domain (DUF836)